MLLVNCDLLGALLSVASPIYSLDNLLQITACIRLKTTLRAMIPSGIFIVRCFAAVLSVNRESVDRKSYHGCF